MFIPKNFKQISTGVIERIVPGDNLTLEISDFYKTESLRILNNDKVHYAGLKESVKLWKPELLTKYKSCLAIGGGNPKLEYVILGCKNIVVADGNADTYKTSDKIFREIYEIPESVTIPYYNMYFKNASTCVLQNAPDIECVSFVHFLEHCRNFETLCDWLKNQTKDIIIYGPNIDVAPNDNWWHFLPPDHNVFFTVKAISDLGAALGYKVDSMTYSDDMLVWFHR